MRAQYDRWAFSFKTQPRRCLAGLLSMSMLVQVTHATEYTLQQAVEQAQVNDPWLQGSVHQQMSQQAQSVDAGTLPDPVVNIGLLNLPSDSFDFSDQNMTQFKVGVTQVFPRGDTRSLKRDKLENLSAMHPLMRADRQAQVAVSVAHLWLEAFRYQQTIRLIEKDRNLFEYLVDVAESSYTSAAGRTRQQDLIRAQLELTQLDDRLTLLKQQRDKNLADLGQWLDDLNVTLASDDIEVAKLYPHLHKALQRHFSQDELALTDILISHPLILNIDQKIHVSDIDIRIAEQSYRPQWGLNASYAYRDESPRGEDRPDFLSLGISFDVPLFTAHRQDKRVQSAKAEFQSTKTQRDLALRELKAAYQSSVVSYQRLKQRQTLFESRLLLEMHQQAEASLTAYTHDDGDFAEAVRARIAELNARIEALNIDIDIHKTLAQLDYFHAGQRKHDLVINDQSRIRITH